MAKKRPKVEQKKNVQKRVTRGICGTCGASMSPQIQDDSHPGVKKRWESGDSEEEFESRPDIFILKKRNDEQGGPVR
ncbi:hypothetical protein [Diaphorobacter caeni]|uniref:hypothetical protein n=1 Tax=Diaphorobacter caeni TaxID=2784387 RepID=UPI00188F9E6F|nr:hypothetical protein [Diaphorobacter caeni]MBF5004753.1 hypothetical protein [Diaphorobacter caeni]